MDPLTPGDIAGLVAALTGDDSPAIRFAGWLQAWTGGHPLCLVETLRSLLERGAVEQWRDAAGRWRLDVSNLEVEGGPEVAVPAAVRAIAEARVARLRVSTRALLVAGAALGDRFELTRAARVASLSEDEGLTALEEAMRTRLLRESGEAPDYYAFAHDVVHEAVSTGAASPRLHVYHRRARDVC